jgi:response regulator RpfG family c-di-GMP phosphodiesterase
MVERGDEVEESPTPQTLPQGDETILVVEDDSVVSNIVQKSLERYGYRVKMATGPDEAIGLRGQHLGEIGLLLTDVVMPGVSGYLKDSTAQVREAEWPLLSKPFSPDELARQVRDLLDGQDERM